MQTETLPVRQAFPGLRVALASDASVRGLSAQAQALEDRTGGRWADLSILDADSRAGLMSALGAQCPFELDLSLNPGTGATPVWMRCVGHWDAVRCEYLCQLADISDLRIAWRPTSERLALLQEMVDSLALLIVQLDAGSGLPCVFAGGSLLELVMRDRMDPVGRNALGALRPELHASLQTLLAQGDSSRTQTFTWRVTDEEGEVRVLEGNMYTQTDTNGRAVSRLIDAIETTAYHATMAELQATEDRLRRFVTASSDGVLICVDQHIIDANPAACHILSAQVEALQQCPLASFVVPEDQPAFEAYIGQPSPEALQCHLIDHNGARIAVELIGRNDQRRGRNVQMVIVRDVRDRRETQARIQALIADLRAQRDRAESADRAKSLFLSAASHDLRQPIHAFGLLLTSLETLLQRATPPRSTVEEVAQRMGHSLDTLSRLLNSLLDVSRLDADAVPVHPMAVSLASILEDLENNLIESARLKGLRLDVVPSDIWVHSDPFVLGRILENLVANAIRYTARGRVLVAPRSRGTHVEIQVWDTGIGIAADQLDDIFGEFYRVRPAASSGMEQPGLGLGLSIVQRSARLLGAQLQVRSNPGRGSMFSVLVPRADPLPAGLAPDQEAPATVTTDKPSAAEGPRHILVIDDDAMVLVAMQQLLQAWGHEVWCAGDVDEAIMQAVAHTDEIDLVLSDYHLAGDVDASQFMDALRACIARPAPVYVFTADTSTRVAREVQSRGLSLMHKPVREDALRQVLQQPLPWKG